MRLNNLVAEVGVYSTRSLPAKHLRRLCRAVTACSWLSGTLPSPPLNQIAELYVEAMDLGALKAKLWTAGAGYRLGSFPIILLWGLLEGDHRAVVPKSPPGCCCRLQAGGKAGVLGARKAFWGLGRHMGAGQPRPLSI